MIVIEIAFWLSYVIIVLAATIKLGEFVSRQWRTYRARIHGEPEETE